MLFIVLLSVVYINKYIYIRFFGITDGDVPPYRMHFPNCFDYKSKQYNLAIKAGSVMKHLIAESRVSVEDLYTLNYSDSCEIFSRLAKKNVFKQSNCFVTFYDTLHNSSKRPKRPNNR